jgi:hypothetical protein
MSDPTGSSPTPDVSPGPRPGGGPQPAQRHIILTMLMVFIGLILLLPGICSVIFITAGGMARGGGDSGLWSLWIVCLGISAFGVWLLVRAAR